MNSSSDLIKRAAEIMRTRGMAKWVQVDRDGSVCVAGAMNMAAREHHAVYSAVSTPTWNMPLHGNAWKMLDTVAREQYPDRVGDAAVLRYVQYPVVDVNNHPDTTIDEMLLLMEKAAVRVEELVSV